MVRRNGRWRSTVFVKEAYGRYRAAGQTMVHQRHRSESDRRYSLDRVTLRGRFSKRRQKKDDRIGLEGHS
jgi:hypothetical protein